MKAIQELIKRYQLASLLVLTLLLAVVLPLSLDIFRLNLIGKYLTYAFVAVGLVMVWGYGGVLSLESESGRGTTARVQLPARVEAMAEVA